MKATHKSVEEAAADVETKAAKKTKIALAGVKKGAIAAREAATKIASAPSRLVDSAVYGACYGVSYGAVFTSLSIAKLLPANGSAMKGFHDGAKVARKDFKARQEKPVITKESTVVS